MWSGSEVVVGAAFFCPIKSALAETSGAKRSQS